MESLSPEVKKFRILITGKRRPLKVGFLKSLKKKQLKPKKDLSRT